MRVFSKLWHFPGHDARRRAMLGALLAVCLLGTISQARAGATLFLEEPYSYDGALAGTGHTAVYLSGVCSVSPVKLRPCGPDELGVVLSRYNKIAGYDWIATPLIPYLYAVDRPEAIPLFADARLVAFLRDQYRREHLAAIVPDRADGETPEGNWYQLIGASYDRTIYGFEIETSPEQDALLIRKFNSQPNRERYNFMRRNCADFVREVVNFYYPHALHRSVIGDLGVTTPKQIAKMLSKYSRRHPDLESSNFLVPQVPGTLTRSKPIRGVLESVVAAKKYMLPLVALHPYIGAGLLATYFGHGRFDPAKDALVLDSCRQLDSPITRDDRRDYQSQLDRLRPNVPNYSLSKEEKAWEDLQEDSTHGLDASRRPVVRLVVGDEVAQVGMSRANVLTAPVSSELAASLIEARLREELRPSASRKTSRLDVERDLALLKQLLSRQPGEVAISTPASDDTGVVGNDGSQ
jgi:hypothetical protein